MTLPYLRSAEPLYVVILHHDDAERLLRQWAKHHQVQVSIEEHRMKIFDERVYSLFLLHWPHPWEDVLVWDCWHKRHIYHD